MSKKTIGIVPRAQLFEDDFPHRDLFLFGNPYVRRVQAQGGIPIGLLCADGYAQPEALALCDAFVLAGGRKLWPYHLQIIEHAHRARKPLLGICLGMQAIAAYFQVLARAQAEGGGLIPQFEAMKKARFLFNEPVENHRFENVTRESAAHAKHPITILPGTRLYEAAGGPDAQAVSLHSYRIAQPAPGLAVSALASDGVIEGVEHGGYLVGVQFHPEVEDRWDPLFAGVVRGQWGCP